MNERWSMSFGEVPERERFLAHVAARVDDAGAPDPLTTYPMEIVDAAEWEALKAAVNQGIDSHLEAIAFSEAGIVDRKTRSGRLITQAGRVVISDPASLHTLIRRLCEIGDDDTPFEGWDPDNTDAVHPAYELASCILETLDIEWI